MLSQLSYAPINARTIAQAIWRAVNNFVVEQFLLLITGDFDIITDSTSFVNSFFKNIFIFSEIYSALPRTASTILSNMGNASSYCPCITLTSEENKFCG